MTSTAAPRHSWAMAFLFPLFFTSGIPALLYQIVWQRALFTIYGTNSESATAVVAAFLLGLGLGAHAGGWLAGRWPRHLLSIYGGIELLIGLYGFFSLAVFDWVGTNFSAVSMAGTGLMAFVLVVLPTLLMGATLPILAAFLVARRGHVGNGVGALYFVNTLGSAFACMLAAEWLMGTYGQHGTILVAALFNVAVGLGAVLLNRLTAVASEVAPSQDPRPPFTLGLGQAALLTAIAGYVSLSFEMVWLRSYGFLSQGTARDFAHVLAFFLAGIALGGLAGRPLSRLASESAAKGRQVPTILFALSSLLAVLCAPVMGLLPPKVLALWALPAVTVVAAVWAALFPVIAHLAVRPGESAGAGIGRLYLANVAGSVAGCLLTGFILMDMLTTGQVSALMAGAGLLAAAFLWQDALPRTRVAAGLGLAGLAVVIGLAFKPLYANLYERLLYREARPFADQFAHVVETKAGVITVTNDRVIYGGGNYDGRVVIDFVNDRNGIFRPLVLSAFHPAPKRVLMIGLSVGSWGQVIVNHPQLEELVVVEINPGYLDLTGRYPEVASLLTNPKVKFVIDDGRRWMRNHQGEGFDLVVMNTTWHWRAFTGNLLSVDFLNLTRKVLNPGGLVYYNATGSSEVARTAAVTFPHAMRFATMMLGSEQPIRIDVPRWEAVVRQYRIDGRPVAGTDPASEAAFAVNRGRLSAAAIDAKGPDYHIWNTMQSREGILADTANLPIITDDNMGLEWRRERLDYY